MFIRHKFSLDKSNYENVKPHALSLWKSEIIQIINTRIQNFTIHPELYQQPKTISLGTLKSKLAKLHEEFVITPADKASNNVIFIWKKYYLEVLRKELTTTNAYTISDKSASSILSEHSDTLKNFNVSLTKAALPKIYWLPKLHKNPYKSRFIANSSNCSLKALSVHLTAALTAIKEHIISYCDTAYQNSGV